MLYVVTVNTSSISGITGSLDFNFSPGSSSVQSASLQILNFSSDGTWVGSPTLTGDATGSLLGTLTFDNGTGYNDYFQEFTYATALSFEISLYGPALSSPDGLSAFGSLFAFSMFSDAAGATPVLTSDTVLGTAVTVAVEPDGTTTLTNNSSETGVTQESAVPEPGSLALAGGFLAVLSAMRLRRRLSFAAN